MQRIVHGLASALTAPIFGMFRVLAVLLSPWRTGRLLSKLTLPRLRAQRLRTTITVLGCSLGVAAVVAVVLVKRSVVQSASSTLADIVGQADLRITGGAGGFDDALLETVRQRPEVAKAVPVLQQSTLLREQGAGDERVLVLGMDLVGGDAPVSQGSASLAAIRADPISFLDSPNHVILGKKLAERFQRGVRDSISLATPHGTQSFEIWGLLEDEGLGRAFGGSVVVMHYQSMQVAFTRGTHLDNIDVHVNKQHMGVEAAGAALRAALGPQVRVDYPDRKGERVDRMLSALSMGLEVTRWTTLQIAAFLIYNTMLISITQRRREIGILRALGMTTRQTLALLTLEGFVISVASAVVGVIEGYVIAWAMMGGVSQAISQLYVPVAGEQVHVDPALMFGCFAVGVVAITLAAAVPTFAAARLKPLHILKGGGSAEESAPRFSLMDVLGIVCLAGALLSIVVPHPTGITWYTNVANGGLLLGTALLMRRFVQLPHWLFRHIVSVRAGVAVYLGNENLPRNLGRTSIVAAAVMVSVAMATSLAVFLGSFTASMGEWVEQNLPADLFVTGAAPFNGTSNVPLTSELAPLLSQVPGVDAVERVRITDALYEGSPIKILAIDMQTYLRRSRPIVIAGDQESAMAEIARGSSDTVIVSENFARRFHVGPGDHVSLPGQRGAHVFRVLGVVRDYTSDLGTLLVNRETYVSHWGDDRVDIYKIYVSSTAELESVRRDIASRYGKTYDLFVMTNREFRHEVNKMLSRVFSAMQALQSVAANIAAMGILIALLANILDRTREIGVLRAVGAVRRQVRRMLLTEAVLIGLVGSITGVLAGLPLGFVMVTQINTDMTGWSLPLRPEWSAVAECALIVLAAAALAGWYPARAAAALNVSAALGRE